MYSGLLISKTSHLMSRLHTQDSNTWKLFYLSLSKPLAACSRLWSRDSASAGVFEKRSSAFIYECIYIYIIIMTLSRHFSLSFIATGRSSGLHPVSSHSCCMYVRAGLPAFARPYLGVLRSTSLMSSPLLLQQCPAWLVRLTWIVFVMGGRWPYS